MVEVEDESGKCCKVVDKYGGRHWIDKNYVKKPHSVRIKGLIFSPDTQAIQRERSFHS